MSEHKEQPARGVAEVRPHQGSYLFEGFMLWLLPVLLGLAIWFRIVPLIILATCLLLTALVVIFWKKNALKHVEPSVKLSTNRVFAGHSFKLSMSIANKKWLPLVWLEWEQARQHGMSWGTEVKGPYIIRLLWLLWYQQIEWEIEGQTERRGVYELGKLTLRSGDAFRFSEQERHFLLPAARLFVYPRLVAVSLPNLRATLAWEMRGRHGGLLEDPLLITGIREYQSGDEWRRIDWRASSKTGVLQTSVYARIVTQHIQLMIDVYGFHQLINQIEQGEQESGQHHGQQEGEQESEKIQHIREEFEWFLSVIASVAVSYQEQKVWVGLASNARDYRGQRIDSVSPSTDLTACLDQLAKLSIHSAFRTERLFDELLINQARYMPIYLFCKHISTAHLNFWQKHSQQFPYLRFFYLHESDESRKMSGVALNIQSLVATCTKKGANQ